MARASTFVTGLAVLGASLAAFAAFAPRSPGSPGSPQAAAPAGEERGRQAYQKWCAGCHGDQGGGDGPAAGHLLPKPRDFTKGVFQIRSTATGELPLDDDLRHVVEQGMPGTSMPGWKSTLSSADRAALVRYVRTFYAGFGQGTPPARVGFGRRPGGGQAAVDSGRALYQRIECWKCHGQAGRGDGRSSPTLKDDVGHPIRAANLTQNWMFNGGGAVADIYHRLRTGLDGTPMPSFGDLIEGHVVTDADLWRVAEYVRSLSPAETPRVRDVVRADRVALALPTGPDDSAWARAERYYFPLVGQVVVKPRWFAPTVNGVWVQALHDGHTLAIRVAWDDPSQSPDTVWNVWRRRIALAMASDDSAPFDTIAPLPDRLAIEFPTRLAEGPERPHFLMGSAEQPVYLWVWESDPRRATESVARGLDRLEPLTPAADTLTSAASYDRCEWRVQFTRSFATADSSDRLQFAPRRPIPLAFFAWDGSNGESGTRLSVGSWAAIYLAEPAGAGTYAWPILAMLSTAGLGLAVVVRAQRTARSADHTT